MAHIIAHRSLDRLVRPVALLLLLAGSVAAAPPPARAAGPILYVRASAIGSGDGSTWANAYPQLSVALADATSGQAIWVAAGTYRPTTGSDRAASFQLKNGVAIYGGFAGTETLLTQRNWTTNVVTLSGDLLGNDVGLTNNTENSYHVVTGATGATLDSVRVSGGYAKGEPGGINNIGSGLYNVDSSPTLHNVIISGNYALYAGGGMYNENSSPLLTNVTFSGNNGYYGGGMYNVNDSSPTLTNLTFSDNYSGYGGAIANLVSSPLLTNVTISGNSALSGGGMYNRNSFPVLTNVTISGNTASDGGGMYNELSSNPVLTDVTISGNTASNGGGGMHNYDHSSPELTNVVISGNKTNSGGGGMHNYDNSNPVLTNVTISGNTTINEGSGGMYNENSSNPQIRNSILWGNSSGIVNTTASTPTISFSLVQGSGGSGAWNASAGSDGGGNLDADPLFVTPVPTAPTLAGDLHLQATSPAIDAGSNTVSNPSLPATDRDGYPRIGNGTVDLGAYELHGPLVFLPMIVRS